MEPRIKIEPELLHQLYWEEGNTQKEISKKLPASLPTIQRRMARLGMRTRDKSEAAFLIADRKDHPNFHPSSSIAYILGTCLGDGSVFSYIQGHEKSPRNVVQLMVRDKDFALVFKQELKNIGLHPGFSSWKDKKYKRNFYTVRSFSKKFVLWYKNLNLEDIANLIFEKEIFLFDFLRGIYDSEGSVSKKGGWLEILANTNKGLIHLTENILDHLKIKYTTLGGARTSTNKEFFKIRILGDANEKNRLLKKIKPSIKRKMRYEWPQEAS
ncbi:MAG: LAGLIDADG family homing endonuclease [Candidatus Hatepunaea meridiana]|nr:LAGLIDADG family homing endonuclease [Candidatus Hatepunaea meridiana]